MAKAKKASEASEAVIDIKEEYLAISRSREVKLQNRRKIVDKACVALKATAERKGNKWVIKQDNIKTIVKASLVTIEKDSNILLAEINAIGAMLRNTEYCPKGFLITAINRPEGHAVANKAKATPKAKGADTKDPKPAPTPNEEAVEMMFKELSYTKKVKAVKAETNKNNVKVLMSTLASSMIELGIKPNEFEIVMLGLEKQKA